jgi:hypothetical protein
MSIAKNVAKFGLVGWLAYQSVALILIAPVLFSLGQTSPAMAVWVGFCSLAGIALSVIVPLWIWRKVT